MKSKLNNATVQKMKNDAEAFKSNPDAGIHDNIIKSIAEKPWHNSEHKSKHKSKHELKFESGFFQHSSVRQWLWLLPSGLTAALVLFLYVYNDSNIAPNTRPMPDNHQKSRDLLVITKTVESMDMAAVSSVIETELTLEMQSEKQALLKDFHYFKTFFAIEDSHKFGL